MFRILKTSYFLLKQLNYLKLKSVKVNIEDKQKMTPYTTNVIKVIYGETNNNAIVRTIVILT